MSVAPIRPMTCVEAFIDGHIASAALRSRALEFAAGCLVFLWLGYHAAFAI